MYVLSVALYIRHTVFVMCYIVRLHLPTGEAQHRWCVKRSMTPWLVGYRNERVPNPTMSYGLNT